MPVLLHVQRILVRETRDRSTQARWESQSAARAKTARFDCSFENYFAIAAGHNNHTFRHCPNHRTQPPRPEARGAFDVAMVPGLEEELGLAGLERCLAAAMAWCEERRGRRRTAETVGAGNAVLER